MISVIVSVYNIEKYIARCLDSLVNQTYRDIEIILVNDGSTDNSGKICDDYAALDNRIQVIHQKNAGPSVARNIGLSTSCGDYIAYIDGDDYICPQYLEILLDGIMTQCADISVCESIVVQGQDSNYFGNCNTKVHDSGLIRYECLSNSEAVENLLYHKIPISCWGKLYKRRIVLEEQFPSGELFEDIYTVYKFFSLASAVAYIKKPLYCYSLRPGSITKRKVYSHKTFDAVKHGILVVEDAKRNHPEYVAAAKSQLVWSCLFIIANIDDAKKNIHDYQYCKEYIERNRLNILRDQKSPNAEKILCVISYLNFRIIRLMYRIRMKGKLN